MTEVDHTPESARRVLMGLYGWAAGRELVEVSIKSPRGKWHAQHWDVATLLAPDTIKQLAWWSEQGREIYMGCVGLTEKPHGSKSRPYPRGGAALRGHAGALWLDVDCQAPGREGDDYFSHLGEAVDIVDMCLGPVLAEASLVIGSGWGLQYWVPLREPVPGVEASRLVRALVGWVGETSTKKIDRVWDTTRVMRMPGTLNWRAGPDEDAARPSGVIRWPGSSKSWDGRLSLANVTDALAAQVTDVTDDWPGEGDFLDWLLERYSPGYTDGAGGADEAGGEWTSVGPVLGDLDRIADEVLGWEDVLVPFGWRCVSGPDPAGREQIWERPGKLDDAGSSSGFDAGERSAVVYADMPNLLVVYSDSPATGFASGLRGSGRRGTAAGVGVISKWRAWVDLACAGDVDEARRRISAGEDGSDVVVGRLSGPWRDETSWMEQWGRERELEALESPFTTTMHGTPDP
jgi:hypothetical protein